MVPTVIFVLDNDSNLPRTSTGKIQRLAIHLKLQNAGIEPVLHAEKLNARLISSVPYEAPSSELENSASSIWQQVFSLSDIGVSDDFYELGGTSIWAARIAFMLSEQSGTN